MYSVVLMFGRSVLLIVCTTGVLLVQATGLHLHAGTAEAAALHGEHSHFADPDGYDHSGDSDVSLSDLSAVWVKLLPFFLPLLVILPLVSTRAPSWVPAVQLSRRSKRSRWRPPLRAPPTSI